MENIRNEKVKGIILRSKVQWIEEGNKPTKFFASIEKRNYINKLINKVNIHDTVVRNQATILKELETFYKNLYTSKIKKQSHQEFTINCNKFLNENNVKKLKCKNNRVKETFLNLK